ncbi:uncharacterized protein [Haliotis cracherodii]|uniref:uncharacterized protein n=1 Tax=Haliotis cracherodii TaxID=6455 RepID=UPI0039EC010A
MKVVVLFTLVLLATGGDAGKVKDFFHNVGQKLGDFFKSAGHTILHELDLHGGELLTAGVQAGKMLLSQGIQGHPRYVVMFQGIQGTSYCFRASKVRRDVSGHPKYVVMFQGIQALALNTANAFTKPDKRSDMISQLFTTLEQDVHGVIDKGQAELKAVMAWFRQSLSEIIDMAANLELTPEEIVQKIDALVGVHNTMVDSFLTTVISGIESVIRSALKLHKRNGFTDFFSNVGSSIASAFSPMVDGVKQMATSAGTAIKASAAGFASAAKDSMNQLGEKLKQHLHTLGQHAGKLVQHGQNALSAMKDAAGDIMKQTLSNMKDPLTGIKQTLTSAGGTIVQQVLNAMSGGDHALAGKDPVPTNQ